MGGANGRCHQLNLRFVEEDDEFRIEETQFQLRDVRLDALGQLSALTIISEAQTHLPNSSHVDEEDEFVEVDYSIDQNFPPIYNIDLDEDDLLEEVCFLFDTVKIVEENDVNHVFDESCCCNCCLRKMRE